MNEWWYVCVDFRHLASKLVPKSIHLKAQHNESMQSHNARPPPRWEETNNQSPQVDAGRGFDEMQQQYCYSWGCSTVYHGAPGNEKWPKTKSVDKIYGDMCWTQAVVHNPSFHYNGAGRWLRALKYFVVILKNLPMLLLSKLYLNRVLLRKENSSLSAASHSPTHMFWISKPVSSWPWGGTAHLNQQVISGTKLSTNKHKQFWAHTHRMSCMCYGEEHTCTHTSLSPSSSPPSSKVRAASWLALCSIRLT